MRVTVDGHTFDVSPDETSWVVSTVRHAGPTAKVPGGEKLANRSYYHYFPSALRDVVDRALKLSLSPDATLTEAVATVATIYALVHEATP